MTPFRFLFLSLTLLLLAVPIRVSAAAADPSVVTSITRSGAGDGFGLDIEVDGNAKPKLVLLRHPYRVALDFDETLSAAKLPSVAGDSLVRDLRHGLISTDRYRLILTLNGPARPDLTMVSDGPVSRYALRLKPGSDEAFTVATAIVPSAAPPAKPEVRKPFIVVLDPGHGGIDKGATGENGTEEKAVNLAFGMGSGGSTALISPGRRLERRHPRNGSRRPVSQS